MKERAKIDPADYAQLTLLHIYLTQFHMNLTGHMIEHDLTQRFNLEATDQDKEDLKKLSLDMFANTMRQRKQDGPADAALAVAEGTVIHLHVMDLFARRAARIVGDEVLKKSCLPIGLEKPEIRNLINKYAAPTLSSLVVG